jgi:hypothetical protein
MDYIELIEEIRAELLQVVNQRCDDMIRMYQNGEPYMLTSADFTP